MPIKTSSAKAKARRLQDWVRDTIYKCFPSLEQGDVTCAIMGESGEDIKLSPAARQLIPISVECKARKSFALYNDYDQATTNAPKGMEPVLFIKGDRKKPLAVIDAEYFLDLMKGRLT
jgi:hypothetical protein